MAKTKVLVVDDSVIIRDTIKDVLSVEDYEVDTAENGAQALDKYARFRPDVVTLDLSMPVMDGYETLARLLKLDKNAQAIIISAFEHDLLKRCMEKGAAGCLMKPFNNEQLVMTIKKLLRIGYDKNLITMFCQVASKIEPSIRKFFDPEASVILKDVNVINQEDLSKIKSVPEIVNPSEMQAPEDSVGYVCEFNGQRNGKIISFIKKGYLDKLFGSTATSGKDNPYVLELFNVINCKVLSTLIENTTIILNPQPTELYDPSKNIDEVWRTVTKAMFEIKSINRIIPFEIHVQYDLLPT